MARDARLAMYMHIFLIGPASVGKSTVGKLLAEALGWEFVDIDQEFCERIQPIGDYLEKNGYLAYCEANSILVDQLLSEKTKAAVFAAPSGFLVHQDAPHLIERHQRLLSQYISVLLLPAEDPESFAEIIVQRQIQRYGNAVNPEEQRKRFLDRVEKYKKYGDIKIFSMEPPQAIVGEILIKMKDIKGRSF